MNTKQIPAWWYETEQGKVAAAMAENAREQERRALIEQIQALDAERGPTVEKLNKELADARAKMLKAQEAARKAERDYNQATARHYGAAHSYDRVRHVLVEKVKANSPTVSAFVRELLAMHEATRDTKPTELEGEFMDGKRRANNLRSIVQRSVAILDAIRQAERLYEEPCDDLPAAIMAIRESLPDIQEPALAVA